MNADQLALLCEGMTTAQLHRSIRQLRKGQSPRLRSVQGENEIVVCGAGALATVQSVLRFAAPVRRRRHEIVRELRERARCFPLANPDGSLNLSSWVGNKNVAWYAVFSYSSPEPQHPWFCSLDEEAQSLVLLLVAAAMETEPT